MVRSNSGLGRPPSEAVLLRMCRSAWAWEWLRHNAHYRQNPDIGSGITHRVLRKDPPLTTIELSRPHNEKWGLCYAENPDLPFQHAALFWHPRVSAAVCPVAAVPFRKGNVGLFDPSRLNVPTTVLQLPNGEQHLLLCDGIHSIQLHVVEGSLLDGPVRLAYVLHNFGKLQEHSAIIERLGVVLKAGRFPANLFAVEQSAERWLLMLKAIQLEAAGYSHTDIAAKLYELAPDTDGFATDWRRSRVRRLLDSGHALIDGDYLKILSRPPKSGSQAA